ncbi:MAG TPA: hypothetical protein VGQ72_13470 [Pyrinomonadaceae bacterium]|nr:hypothetical protein [Pyrinomonadaceae bacterium]
MPPLQKLHTGTWYIVVTCEKCKSTIFLFPDLTEGRGVLDANYIVACPRCSHKGAYTAQHYYESSDDEI